MNTEELIPLLSLNSLFNTLGQDLNDIINFLRFIDDEKANHLIEIYDSLPAREKGKLDLDRLADRAGFTQGSVRSILIAALVEYEIDCTSLLLVTSKQALVRKSLEVALGDGPEAQDERREFMRYFGYFE